MKLNWFSPLPPAKTGIADYTLGLLPALSKQAEVVLWTDQSGWDRALEQHATVRQYHAERMDWVEFNRANLSFYHIGNNHRFHTSIWQVSRRAPGIVILHDVRLHDFFESLYRGQWRDERGYLLMAVTIRRDGEVAIVELSGEFTLGRGAISQPLDLHGARLEDLEETLRRLLDETCHPGRGGLRAGAALADQRGFHFSIRRPQKRRHHHRDLIDLRGRPLRGRSPRPLRPSRASPRMQGP